MILVQTPTLHTIYMHVNDILTYGNPGDWLQEMKNFLYAKNKIGFVDGTINTTEEGLPEFMKWMRCDAMIKGWLTTTMEKTTRSSVKYANTSAKIWADLEERFGKESAPHAYELKMLSLERSKMEASYHPTSLLYQDVWYLRWNSVSISNPKVHMWQVHMWSREKADRGKRKRKIIRVSYGDRHHFFNHKNPDSCI